MALVHAQQVAPDRSWRVGVGRVAEHEADLERAAEAAAASGAASRLILGEASRSNARSKLRPAVMTVSLASAAQWEEAGAGSGGGGGGAAGTGGAKPVEDTAAVTIELWRADLLAGTIELGPGCIVTRADAGLGLMFGINPLKVLQHHLHK